MRRRLRPRRRRRDCCLCLSLPRIRRRHCTSIKVPRGTTRRRHSTLPVAADEPPIIIYSEKLTVGRSSRRVFSSVHRAKYNYRFPARLAPVRATASQNERASELASGRRTSERRIRTRTSAASSFLPSPKFGTPPPLESRERAYVRSRPGAGSDPGDDRGVRGGGDGGAVACNGSEGGGGEAHFLAHGTYLVQHRR